VQELSITKKNFTRKLTKRERIALFFRRFRELCSSCSWCSSWFHFLKFYTSFGDQQSNGSKIRGRLVTALLTNDFEIVNPSWRDIEEAIRHLDKDTQPGLYISCEEEHLRGRGFHYLWIQLEEDGYKVGAVKPSSFEPIRCFGRPSKDQKELDWNKPAYGRHEIAEVLQIAKYFAVTGECAPEAVWRHMD
jgi:hypothetical protein